MSELRIGVSGWKYRKWRGDFYPSGLRQADELGYLAQRMNSAEINGSFYSLAQARALCGVARCDPGRLPVRGEGRTLHHPYEEAQRAGGGTGQLLRLRAARTRRQARAFPVAVARGPAFDPTRLRAFLELLPRTTEAVAELAQRCDRDIVAEPSPRSADAGAPPRSRCGTSRTTTRSSLMLREHGVALVLADTASASPVR